MFLLFFTGYVEQPIDIAFLADSSSSVNWSQTRSFVKDVIDSLDISEKTGHVAFMSYAAKASLGFDFYTHSLQGYTKAGAAQLIDKIKQLGGDERSVNQGLDMAGYMFHIRAGARDDARKVCDNCLLHFLYHTLVLISRTSNVESTYPIMAWLILPNQNECSC